MRRVLPAVALLFVAPLVAEFLLGNIPIFDPDYVGLDLLRPAYIPALGMGGWWTIFVLTLHTVWSISVPIAIIETLAGPRRTAPWLGRVGLSVTAVLLVLGAAAITSSHLRMDDFVASAPQFLGAGAVIVVLVVAGTMLGRRPGRARASEHRAPNP